MSDKILICKLGVKFLSCRSQLINGTDANDARCPSDARDVTILFHSEMFFLPLFVDYCAQYNGKHDKGIILSFLPTFIHNSIIVSTCFNVRATDSRTWCSLICSILNPLWRNMTFVDQDCLHTRCTEGIACAMLCHLFLASICLLWGDHSQSTVLLPKTTIKIRVYCFKWAMLHPQTDLLVSF